MNFSGYLISVISASAIGIIADIVNTSYGKHGKEIEKYVKLAVSICVLGCILAPAMKEMDFDDIFENDLFAVQTNKTVNENDSLYLMEKDVNEKVSQHIFSETGIKPVKVIIDMELEEEKNGIIIKKATIMISSDDAVSSEIIKNVTAKVLETEVDIEYDE